MNTQCQLNITNIFIPEWLSEERKIDIGCKICRNNNEDAETGIFNSKYWGYIPVVSSAQNAAVPLTVEVSEAT